MRGYFFAIAATAIWSGNFIIARGLSDNIPPVSLAFWRWAVAIIVLLPFALRPLLNERHILKKHIRYLSVTALLGITVFNTLIYIAGHTTSALNLSLISITFPIFIILLMRIFYRELITVKKRIGVSLVAAGVVVLITQGDPSILLDVSFAIGDVCMLVAAITFAIYSIQLKRKPKELSIWALQLSTFLLGLLFLLPFFIWESMVSPAVQWEMTTLVSILYVGIFASLTAFVLWNKAIIVIGPAKAGMVYYTLPLFSGVLAYLFLQERISSLHFFSAAFILSGILVANNDKTKEGN
ncbi:MAG: DMT family transporter [Desulfuromusa sp.]|nr:DMT family transporter [Desulfuromusa sp.]